MLKDITAHIKQWHVSINLTTLCVGIFIAFLFWLQSPLAELCAVQPLSQDGPLKWQH